MNGISGLDLDAPAKLLNSLKWILMGVILILSNTLVDRSDAQPINGLSLDLTLGSPGMETKALPAGALDLNEMQSAVIGKIMQDDITGDFQLTEIVINHLASELNNFALREKIESEKASGGIHAISAWLTSSSSGSSINNNPMIKRMAEELDHLYSSYWSQFHPLLNEIITVRPANLGRTDLAFRCERYEELKNLAQLASTSSFYRMTVDTFSMELYTHCLRRKLALLQMENIEPTAILRQFVDIYLDLPPTNNQLELSNNNNHNYDQRQLQAGMGLNFNLQRSIAKFGNLESAASLVADVRSFMSSERSSSDIAMLVGKFREDCRQYTGQLAQVWSTFDEMAILFSSPMSNLADFNAKIKLVVPQLAYGSICNQLANLP